MQVVFPSNKQPLKKLIITEIKINQLLNKISLKSRCFYRELEANSVAFLPEGLFDNLIDLQYL